MADKSAMRRNFRSQRDDYVGNLTAQDLGLSFSNAPSPLKTLFQTGQHVAGYIPIGSEADPRALLTAAEELGCIIALPHVVSKISPMRFLRWSYGDALEQGPFGLMQPPASSIEVRPDVILVPLVAFDRRLNRLGQGAGHYDRALSVLMDAVSIGVAWSVQEADMLPVDPWDIPLSAILTEKEWMTS